MPDKRARRWWWAAAVVVFLVAAVAVVPFGEQTYSHIGRDRVLPEFALPSVQDPAQTLRSRDLAGRVVLLNVWASWCLACRDEHALLLDVSRTGRATVYGLNYRDQREDALRWLRFYGDPFVLSAHDLAGAVGGELGVKGIPQTFVIDQRGAIRYRHVGPLDEGVWAEKIAPLLKELAPYTVGPQERV